MLVKPFSIEDAYGWGQRFVAREWRLVLPVAFALLAVPQLVLDLLIPEAVRAQLMAALQTNNTAAIMDIARWWFPLNVLVLLLGAIGGMAICALALQPGISVREALTLGLRRLGVFVGSQLLIVAGVMLVAVAVVIAGQMGHAKPAAIQSLLLGIVFALGLFVGIRLAVLVPMIVRRRIGPISALRESWIMTAGAFWRIFGAIGLYLIGAIVVTVALSTGVGALLLLFGKTIGQPELGNALNIVFQRGITALAAAGAYLLTSAIFRQLDGPRSGA